MVNCSYCEVGNYDLQFHFRKCCNNCSDYLELVLKDD